MRVEEGVDQRVNLIEVELGGGVRAGRRSNCSVVGVDVEQRDLGARELLVTEDVAYGAHACRTL